MATSPELQAAIDKFSEFNTAVLKEVQQLADAIAKGQTLSADDLTALQGLTDGMNTTLATLNADDTPPPQ